MNTSKINFYNIYHHSRKNKTQKKARIISDSNYTYYQILKFINKVRKPKSRVLDLGCGVGSISNYVAKNWEDVVVTGVDVSSDAIEVAKNTSEAMNLKNISFVNQDINYYLKDRLNNAYKFDIVILSEVIEHIKDDEGLLKNIYKIISTGGCLVLTTPSIDAPLYRLGLLNDFDDEVGHIRRYRSQELAKLIESQGFKVKTLVQTEGIFRNSLFTQDKLGFLVRYIKGPLVKIAGAIDHVLGLAFGFSDIQVIAVK